jgi:hypothetical protein
MLGSTLDYTSFVEGPRIKCQIQRLLLPGACFLLEVQQILDCKLTVGRSSLLEEDVERLMEVVQRRWPEHCFRMDLNKLVSQDTFTLVNN